MAVSQGTRPVQAGEAGIQAAAATRGTCQGDVPAIRPLLSLPVVPRHGSFAAISTAPVQVPAQSLCLRTKGLRQPYFSKPRQDRPGLKNIIQNKTFLKNVGQNGGKPKLDLNVEAAWAQGYTGRNITTAIMDDGVDYMHPDLRENYNARASYDFSSNDPYPYPRYTDDWFNRYNDKEHFVSELSKSASELSNDASDNVHNSQ
ncbi:Neuroendocrine convertase 2 [Araneus ventricosus]|uniref:Neuroendocrine convertase 2 n=1 Tax=Araneus ventricosus TaxID=182803 RepID=A0A4Y2DL35_ARAVE|nr:Neuroendocrine convertase 2 [Araneus ventricosus]